MKGKILTLIIGILIGAVIATGGFYLYEQSKSSDVSNGMEQMGERPDGEFEEDGNMTPGNFADGEAPDKPDGEGGGDGETPPDMPSGSGDSTSDSSEEE